MFGQFAPLKSLQTRHLTTSKFWKKNITDRFYPVGKLTSRKVMMTHWALTRRSWFRKFNQTRSWLKSKDQVWKHTVGPTSGNSIFVLPLTTFPNVINTVPRDKLSTHGALSSVLLVFILQSSLWVSYTYNTQLVSLTYPYLTGLVRAYKSTLLDQHVTFLLNKNFVRNTAIGVGWSWLPWL